MPVWNPPTPEIHELQALVRRLETLEEMRVMEENRLVSGVMCAAIEASLQEHLAYLEQPLEKALERALERASERARLLCCEPS